MVLSKSQINKKTSNLLYDLGLIDQQQSLFPFCKQEIEKGSHVFFISKHTWKIWGHCLKWWGVFTALHKDIIANLESWQAMVMGSFKNSRCTTILFSTIQNIWQERNTIKFQSKNTNLVQLIEHIKMKADFLVKYFAKEFPYSPWQVVNNIEGVSSYIGK